jgi:hypothetical protein
MSLNMARRWSDKVYSADSLSNAAVDMQLAKDVVHVGYANVQAANGVLADLTRVLQPQRDTRRAVISRLGLRMKLWGLTIHRRALASTHRRPEPAS